uniref:Putative secreted protein n=1 Tax=Anopheles marajoara TaxID=58244 RepID=A0A2M4C998_9DIPT
MVYSVIAHLACALIITTEAELVPAPSSFLLSSVSKKDSPLFALCRPRAWSLVRWQAIRSDSGAARLGSRCDRYADRSSFHRWPPVLHRPHKCPTF